MILDDLRFTSVLHSPRWQREAALRLLKLLGYYSLLSLGGAFLLFLGKAAIASVVGTTAAPFIVGLIWGGAGAFLLYRWQISKVKTLWPSARRIHIFPHTDLELPPTVCLTEPQKEILVFIQESLRERGIAPTHQEIRQKFGLSSYGTVYRHLKLLQEKGFLRRDWNQKRGIELIRGIPGGEGSDRGIPFLGRIAAGRPIEALSGSDRVAVPGYLLSHSGDDHYVLRVVGESMIDEGIHDGDFVIVLRRDLAEPGDMVVVLIGDDATLKRFYPEGNLVRLQPANPTMQPIRLPARDVRVQGVVVGLMRKY
jgi:repressor LexA